MESNHVSLLVDTERTDVYLDAISKKYYNHMVRLFRAFEIEVSTVMISETYQKCEMQHIAVLLSHEDIASAWCNEYGLKPTKEDVSNLYELLLHLEAEESL